MNNYNYIAFVQRYTLAIQLNLLTDKKQFIIKRGCLLLNRFDEYLRYQVLKKWSEEFRLSQSILQSYIDNKPKFELSKTELLTEFLTTFVIRQNEISGELDIEKSGEKYTLEELTILVEEENLSVRNLPKLLNPENKKITVVDIYNPLQSYFEKLADSYRGEPLIHQLASCIKAYDFGDEKNGFYQERLEYYFHKWLCKAAGQALHISANDVMLLWVEGEGGSGKSFLNRWLFSLPEINNYYIRIGENESFMDMKGISRAKFAIDWDELPLSKKRYITFKSHIAAETGQVYNKKSKSYKPYNRQVNFLGSTNMANRKKQKGYLLDEDTALMRRIAPIEIIGRIDYKKYMNDIDLVQLWAQAANEIIQAKETNNKKLLTWECDWDDLRKQNSRYVKIDLNENKIAILNIFKRTEPGQGMLLSASEIVKQLKLSGYKADINEYEIGKLFSLNGYCHKRNGITRGWWVKQ